MRLPKHMTTGQKEALRRDFAATFEGCDEAEIDAEALFEWATNTKAVYEWFYTRFADICTKRLSAFESLATMERTYKPTFLQWETYQTMPCVYADFIASMRGGKWAYSGAHAAGDMIYDYYLKSYKESRV